MSRLPELSARLGKFRRSPELFFRDARYQIPRLLRRGLSRPEVMAFLEDPVEAAIAAEVPVVTALARAYDAWERRRRRELWEVGGEPTVSVVMPAWNAAGTIGEAIGSLLEQSYRSLEIIVVDDASDDETAAVAEAAAAGDPRVVVLRNQRQGGAAWSRNRGIERASGEFVTFQDADDVSHPERIERQLAELLRRPRAVVCVCNGRREDDVGRPVAVNGQVVAKWVNSMMFRRREVLERIGFLMTELRVGEDAEYYERIKATFGERSEIVLFKTLYFARFSPESLLFSDGATEVGEGAVRHRRSTEAEAAIEATRARHREIRAGRLDPYVGLDRDAEPGSTATKGDRG